MINLHPSAIENFDKKAEALVQRVQELKREPTVSTFQRDVHVSAMLNFNTASAISCSQRDYRGNTISDYFLYQNKFFGLSNSDYAEFDKLVGALHKCPDFKRYISRRVLSKNAFEWIKEKYSQEADTTFCDAVIAKCEALVESHDIWIPIALLYIQSDFQLGQIVFRSLTKSHIDAWELRTLQSATEHNATEEEKNSIKQYFLQRRKKLQGLAMSTMTVVAEAQQAFDTALEETEKTLSMLRFFSPANFLTEVSSFCTVYGKENVEAITAFLLKEDQLMTILEPTLNPPFKAWELDTQLVEELFKSGLSELDELLKTQQLTEFQQDLLDALLLYSRSSLHKEIADKLVYILVAMESLLLKNSSEPIQQNISERLALFIGNSVAEKQQIISITKQAYALRSAFVHHGHEVADIETMTAFMKHAWNFFYHVLINKDRFSTKNDFLDAIEVAKLS